MNYKFQVHLTGLKDLEHIEWFVLHADEYMFQGREVKETLDRLKHNIQKKNIFYSDIINDYETLLDAFNNDPYEYAFNLRGSEKEVQTDKITDYFVDARDCDGEIFRVPYGYIASHRTEDFLDSVAKFKDSLLNAKNTALNTFEAIESRYLQYSGGVSNAISRFNSIHMGKDYHLARTMIFYLIYNVLLMIVIRESKFFPMVLRFWQYFSNDMSLPYSVERIFSGHLYLGILVLIWTAYYIYSDAIYSYGLYKILIVMNELSEVKRHNDKVSLLYSRFKEDYERCKNDINENDSTDYRIARTQNRESIYIPLITKASRNYAYLFDDMPIPYNRENETHFAELIPKSSMERKSWLFKKPIEKKIIWMILLWIIVRIICYEGNIVLY